MIFECDPVALCKSPDAAATARCFKRAPAARRDQAFLLFFMLIYQRMRDPSVLALAFHFFPISLSPMHRFLVDSRPIIRHANGRIDSEDAGLQGARDSIGDSLMSRSTIGQRHGERRPATRPPDRRAPGGANPSGKALVENPPLGALEKCARTLYRA